DRTVTLNFTEGGSVTLAPNAGANVLASVEVESDSRRLNVVVKAPTAPSLADFAGVWRGQFLRYPARLRETYYNSVTMTSRTTADSSEFAGPDEDLVDVFLTSQAESSNDLLNIDAMGNVSGASQGTLSIAGSALTFTPSSGNPPVTVYPNAATDVLITGEVSADDLGMINLVKVSATPAETFDELVDLKVTILPGGAAQITWNEGSNFRLVKSTTLDGESWTEVGGTGDSGSYEDSEPVSSAFYRIEALGD
ncbi:MAG: hypothetical protein HKN82_03280, partial [Akkermansiaceae bacterium]|nr:hypothetical protein [Akkermansiaceae bacterium]